MCEISQILTDFCKVVVALKCVYCIFLIHVCWLFNIFLLLLKLLQLRWLVVICLHIKVTGIFWGKANSLETDNNCYLFVDVCCWLVG